MSTLLLSYEDLQAAITLYFGPLKPSARAGGRESIFRVNHRAGRYVELIPLPNPTRLVLNAGFMSDGSLIFAGELPTILRLEPSVTPGDVRIVTALDLTRQLVFTVFATDWLAAHVEASQQSEPPT